VLESIAALANSSPNANFIMDSEIANLVGRDRTFPKVVVKSAFVMGLGDTAFTGPEIDSSAMVYRISPSNHLVQSNSYTDYPFQFFHLSLL
jgi:hypothetical protein